MSDVCDPCAVVVLAYGFDGGQLIESAVNADVVLALWLDVGKHEQIGCGSCAVIAFVLRLDDGRHEQLVYGFCDVVVGNCVVRNNIR